MIGVTEMLNIPSALAAEFKLTEAQVVATIAPVDDGNTIPFIARYRKEATGLKKPAGF